MSDVTPWDGGGPSTEPVPLRLTEWARAARAAAELAETLCRTSFVPESFRGKPTEAMAAILLGDQLGLAPLAALGAVYVVGGRPAMYTATKVALLARRGHRVWTVRESDTAVTVAGHRAGDPADVIETVTWTLDRAKAAGYAQRNRNYQTNPRAMLWARAAGDVASRIAPDVLLGLPDSVEDSEPAGGPEGPLVVQRAARPMAETPAQTYQASDGPGPSGPEGDVTGPEPDPEPDPAPPADPLELEPMRPEPVRSDPPPTISPGQSKMLHAVLSQQGYTEREAYLEDISAMVGRVLTTTNELTREEAARVLDFLTRGPS